MSNIAKIKKIIINAPIEPGVYFFKDSTNAILYVGKAIKLKNRLKSYVDKNLLKTLPRIHKMVSSANSVEWVLTNTELEALVLEANLIKKYKPEYNINLKDDKAYKYIEIKKSKDNNNNGSYKINTSRKKEGAGSYFGPFPSGKAVNIVLRDLRKLFPYRNCTNNKFERYKKLQKPCLYGHIGLCPAPCQGIEQTNINNANVDKIKRFLQGNYKTIIKNLENEMKMYSSNLEYEKAAEIRDRLEYYKYLSQKYRTSEELMRDMNFQDNSLREVYSLVTFLSLYFEKLNINNVENKPDFLQNFRIEFYDISNLGNEIIVGSFITLVGGVFDKNSYRKFKIKTKTTQDDFAAMQEIINRRIKHLSDWGIPNLIVIDGGKGQLSVVTELLNQNNIPFIGLAKKQETIVIHKDNKYTEIQLPENDLGLQLLIKGRNEVHRFGITYNKSLRKIAK